jgi:hypothetical protein
MMIHFPVLAFSAGLGDSFSFAQTQQQTQYSSGIQANHPKAALVRFAGECGQ